MTLESKLFQTWNGKETITQNHVLGSPMYKMATNNELNTFPYSPFFSCVTLSTIFFFLTYACAFHVYSIVLINFAIKTESSELLCRLFVSVSSSVLQKHF